MKETTIQGIVYPSELQPTKRDYVWKRHVSSKPDDPCTGLCRVASGDKVTSCLRQLKRQRFTNPDGACMAALKIYGWYCDWYGKNLCSLITKSEFDLLVIEDEGSIVSGIVKIIFQNRIRAQANILLKRHAFQATAEQPARYEYRVVRPSVGPDFGHDDCPLLIIDPTLATGGSITAFLEWFKTEYGIEIAPKRITIWTIVAAPYGVNRLCNQGMRIVTAEIADGLNKNGFIADSKGEDWIGSMADFFRNCISHR
ncbi:hypothetical protein KC644_02265 [Candidatus Berkelbacteria bacterium]|nr:hypothetical protein [Candidatus Berkelbacteria bacterium]